MIEKFKNLKNKIGHKVKTVAVSKRSSVEEVLKVYTSNHKDFGENRVKDLISKYNELPKDINWHMIGHLQTNKVKKVVPIVSLIHSIDSIKLLKIVNKESKKINKVTNCLIQINISQESTKYGFDNNEIDFLNKSFLKDYENIKIRGLMGMASFSNEENIVKSEFENLNKIYNNVKNSIDDINILSMGMSNDYKLALEAGSNMVRIGSKIFGARNYQ